MGLQGWNRSPVNVKSSAAFPPFSLTFRGKYALIYIMKYRFRLISQGAGSYTSDSLLGLAWAVLTHRLWHLWRGDGWVD